MTVLGFDEVVSVLRDNETYSSSVYEGVIGMVMGRTILQMDEPEHRSVRALVAGSFRSKMLERWEEDLVALVVNELIDSFADRGRSDLVRDVTFNFPVQVIARILGLPRGLPAVPALGARDHQRRRQLGPRHAASAALRDYFVDVMSERRATPGTTSSATWCAPRSTESISTTRRSAPSSACCCRRGSRRRIERRGASSWRSSTTRPQFDALYGDRSLFAQAFEEALRWEPPVTVILRRATCDTELAGVGIEKGADIALMIGAANRDERKYTDPGHLRHVPGAAATRGVRLRCPRMPWDASRPHGVTRGHQHAVRPLGPFTLDPDAVAPHIEGLAFRSPLSLPVGSRLVDTRRRRVGSGRWVSHWTSGSTGNCAWARAIASSGPPTRST